MDAFDNNPSDSDIFQRLLNLTRAGRLDWKQVYEDGGTHPTENIERSTSPQGYMCFDEYFGFGRAAVELEMIDPEEDETRPLLHVSGNQLDVSAGQIDRLIDVIEDYIDTVQAGEMPSMAERVNQKIQKRVEPLQRQIQALEEELAHRDERIHRLVTIIENTTRPDGLPPMTPENVREVLEETEMEIAGEKTDLDINLSRNDLSMAIKNLE